MTLGKGSDPILRRFQLQFIAITVSFVFVLLAAVFAVASYVTYSEHMADVYTALNMRTERMHGMPVDLLLETTSAVQSLRDYGFDADALFFEGEGPGGGRDRGELRDAGGDPLTATSAYLLDQRGDIQMIVSNALSLDENTVEEAMDDIRSHLSLDEDNTETGKINTLNLFYQLRKYENGYSVALASGNYVDRALASLVSSLGIAELAAFLALSGLVIVLSGWVLKPVEDAWAQQRQFVADASHELKTPLSVIRANNSLIMANPDASVASQMQWIESNETEANLMQDLVNDMLFLAQSENNRNEVVRSRVDMTDLVQSSFLQFESVAFERGVFLDEQIAPDIHVEGEPKSLLRLVGTLIDNAIKYADDGGQVNVRLWKQGSSCSLRVRNTGSPISAEDLPHLFDRFYRSDKARTREETGGFGLGLAIAKNIVDEHKGTISVASTEADGTAFTVTLPLA